MTRSSCNRIALFIIGSWMSLPTFAQPLTIQLDSLFTALATDGQFNGNALVAQNGQVLYKKSVGLADFDKQLPNTDSSTFTLASVAKVFTSVAVLRLKEQGKLRLDDPYSRYVPAFPYAQITIRQLLSHTSGLPDYELFEELIRQHPDTVLSNQAIIPTLRASQRGPLGKAGERWSYSNLNYCLLAILVETLTHSSFQAYLRKHVFEPAGMTNTSFLTNSSAPKKPHQPINYEYPTLYTLHREPVETIKKFRWRLHSLKGLVGQGNVVSTAADLLTFDQALYAGKIIGPKTLAEAFTPTRLTSGEPVKADIGLGPASYGLGWFILADELSGQIVFHSGGVPGSVAIFLRNITKRQTVILLDNANSPGLYRNGVNALALLNKRPVKVVKKSLVREYGSTLAEKGVDSGFSRLMELKADSVHYSVKEADLNELGLRLLYEATFPGHQAAAAEVLKLNVLFYPSSFNTYDSYGEVLASMDRKKEAIWMYQKSLALNPANKSGQRALQRLLR